MKIKYVGWIALSILLLPVAPFYVSIHFEITESNYATYEEMASTPRVFDSGWIPSWLPKTASQIKESHDIDTNEAWLVFNFPSSDNFYEHCQTLERDDVLLPTKRQSNRFPNFVSSLIVEVQKNTVDFYQCDHNLSRFLAVDHMNKRAFVWMAPFTL